ncbi:MAG: ferrochelatase [Actinomycetes bacterium]
MGPVSVDSVLHGDRAAEPFDAVVLLSFGGPEAPEEVMPFLENVTRGRGIPAARLAEVAEHYLERGGRSPINDRNRELLTALRSRLADRGIDVPVYWGNRNWAPYLTDVLREAHDDGCRRVLVLATSAYSSYSGCRQYREDVAAALLTLAGEGRTLHVDKARSYFNHPGFVTASVDAVLRSLDELGRQEQAPRLVFVTHSIPTAMADTSGPDGGAYVAQHQDIAAVVTRMVGERTGQLLEWDLVYCSRSGPPSQPWLEPDVNDHLEALADAGTTAVVLVPIGFVSDHMEVVHDLDTEAAETAARRGLRMARAATAGVHPAFVDCLVDLVVERAAAERGEVVRQDAVGSLRASHGVCPVGCCPNLRTPGKAAACGADWTDVVPTVVAP